MKYRKWAPKTEMKIVLEGLESKVPLAGLCKKVSLAEGDGIPSTK